MGRHHDERGSSFCKKMAFCRSSICRTSWFANLDKTRLYRQFDYKQQTRVSRTTRNSNLASEHDHSRRQARFSGPIDYSLPKTFSMSALACSHHSRINLVVRL